MRGDLTGPSRAVHRDDRIVLRIITQLVLTHVYRVVVHFVRVGQFEVSVDVRLRCRDEGLVDLARGEIVPFETLLDELLSLVWEDAKALGCQEEVGAVRNIYQRGRSALRQLRDYDLERAAGASPDDALKAVVDTLIADTAKGV